MFTRSSRFRDRRAGSYKPLLGAANSYTKCNSTPTKGKGDLACGRLRFSSKRRKPSMTYRQITYAERYTLGALRQQGLSAAAIARALGRHRSTILREVRRNRKAIDGGYRPLLANWYAMGRRWRSRRNWRFSAAEFALVRTLLCEHQWSPEQIAGRLRREGRSGEHTSDLQSQ